jgi:hypothetical protein
MSRSPNERLVRVTGKTRSARQGRCGCRHAHEAGAAPPAPQGGVAPPPASAAAMLSPRSGLPSLVRILQAAALATLFGSVPAAAQTMEDRARAAAGASRAKTSDSEALRRNYLTPGLAGQPIATIDNSRSFTPNLACQKSATLLEVLIQPSATGDIGAVQIARDSDFDGAVDSRTTLPVAVSGICANGVIACQPGTWTQCHYLSWQVDAARAPKLAEVDMGELAGCYCVNNSCGTNLVWGNLPSVLGDLGGGMVGALTTADPRIGVAQALIDGPVIRYVGAQTTACTEAPALPQTGYRANPTALAGDAFAASAGNSVFQALSGSAAGLGRAELTRRCTIERQVTVVKPEVDAIVSRDAGGYSTVRTGNAVDFFTGSPTDNSLGGGSCSLFDFHMTLHVSDPALITDARLAQWFADDWGQLRIDGMLVASGPTPWTSTGVPAAVCELARTFYAAPDLDLKPWLTKGDHDIWLRVAVSKAGEAMAQVHVQVDDACRTSEHLVDACAPLAADAKCRLDSENVDGVETFRNSVATGLRPLRQTRVLGTAACPVQLTRDFFLRDRAYKCATDGILPAPDLSRGAYIIDHSTETLIADRVRLPDGSMAASTRPFAMPDRGAVTACEPVCKTRAPRVSTGASPAGVVANQQNNPAGYDTFYHSCSADNVCPAEVGEELVSACGCLDDFPEAVVMMQTVRLAGADMVCTAATR